MLPKGYPGYLAPKYTSGAILHTYTTLITADLASTNALTSSITNLEERNVPLYTISLGDARFPASGRLLASGQMVGI